MRERSQIKPLCERQDKSEKAYKRKKCVRNRCDKGRGGRKRKPVRRGGRDKTERQGAGSHACTAVSVLQRETESEIAAGTVQRK